MGFISRIYELYEIHLIQIGKILAPRKPSSETLYLPNISSFRFTTLLLTVVKHASIRQLVRRLFRGIIIDLTDILFRSCVKPTVVREAPNPISTVLEARADYFHCEIYEYPYCRSSYRSQKPVYLQGSFCDICRSCTPWGFKAQSSCWFAA